MDALKYVDILDRIRIHVFPEKFHERHTGRFVVQLDSVDPSLQVIVDDAALNTLNEEIVKRAAAFEARDPRAQQFIEEFVARMISSLYKNGLVVLEKLPDAPKDHYQAAKELILKSRRS